MTKLAHFLFVKTTYEFAQYAMVYLDEITRLHRIPMSIILDCGPHFTMRFFKDFQEASRT